MGRTTILYIAVFCVALCNGLKLPAYIKGCSQKDPNFNACALKSAQELFRHSVITTGDRKYGVPSLDPLVIDELNIDQGSLNIHYKNLKIYGLKHAQMKAIRYDLKNRHLEYEFDIPKMLWVTKYNINGKILVVPIVGQGNNNITILDSKAKMVQDFELKTKKNGKQHLFIKKSTITSTLGGLMTVMDGLFNGDKRLGEHMQLFLNENWQEVEKELGPAFNAALAEVATSVFNVLADHVPFNELFPENP